MSYHAFGNGKLKSEHTQELGRMMKNRTEESMNGVDTLMPVNLEKLSNCGRCVRRRDGLVVVVVAVVEYLK